MCALEQLEDSALQAELTRLNERKGCADQATAGIPGGDCAGFWLRRYTPHSRRKGREHENTACSQSALIVHEGAYNHKTASFYGQSADTYEVQLHRQSGVDKVVRGTFRAAGKNKCMQSSAAKETFVNGMCGNCAALEYNKPLQTWVSKNMAQHQEAGAEIAADPRCNNKYLTGFEREHKMTRMASNLKAAHKRGDYFQNQLLAWKSRPVDVAKELSTHFPKDSIEVAICAKLLNAKKGGHLKPKHANLLDIIRDQCKNITHKPQGYRYTDASKSLSAALCVKYGANCPNWLEENVLGPSNRTIGRYLPQAQFQGGYKDTRAIVTQAKDMYRALMSTHELKPGSVACYLAEDETGIQAEASYHQKSDTIVGLCGTIGCGEKDHECTLDGHCHIGVGGTEGYNRILEAMNTSMVGNNARCIMLCPLHRGLPALVVLLATTCNRFSAEGYVSPQWVEVSKICNEVLGDVVGRVIGHASDGDSRRHHLMVKQGSPGMMARETKAELAAAMHATTNSVGGSSACPRFEPTSNCAG